MSTLHFTPPTTGRRSHPVGFNDHTYDDPFFPSSPSEEQLVQLDSDHSPSQHSYHTASPSHTFESIDGVFRQSSNPPSNYDTLQLPSQNPLSSGYVSDVSLDNASVAHAFLSPGAYILDNGYNASSEHTATPGIETGFYLEDDFGILEDPDQDIVLEDPGHLTQDNTVIGSSLTSHYNRTSTGTATLSSHLLSPVLTNAEAPGSRAGTASPPADTAYVKSAILGKMSMGLPMNNSMRRENRDQDHPPGAIQQTTPTLTESSKGTSPELDPVVPHIVRAPSPVVRVEKYTRGDSPARGSGMLGRDRTKRSRAGSSSSHLAVYHDNFSEEEDIDGADGAPLDGRVGLSPDARFQIGHKELPNLRDQESRAQQAMKDADVAAWLDRSEPINEAVDAAPRKPAMRSKRQRAKSAGAQCLSHANLGNLKAAAPVSHIPGPGALNDEESSSEMEDEEAEVASIENSPPPTTVLGGFVNDTPGKAKPGVYDELSNQPPLYRAKLWQDSLYDSSDPRVKMQPDSSNAAIMRLQQRAGDIETSSRVATWGTRRRSESDLESLFHRFSFSDKPIEKPKGKRERSGSFLQQAAAKLVPRRTSAAMKRQESETAKQQAATRPTPLEHSRSDSQSSRKESLGALQTPKGLQRLPTLGKKPKSPRINTGSAVAAMAFQASAFGVSGSVSATGTSSPTGWPKNLMKRSTSRNEFSGDGIQQRPSSVSATDLNLAEIWKGQGGPPIPTLAAPSAPKHEESCDSFADPEDDDDEEGEDAGVATDLSVRPDAIVPTLEGFKSHIQQLNPRLPPFMFDRIAQEQLRRFKKLLDFKIGHAQALSIQRCPSGKHCTELGGEPTYLPPKPSGRDSDKSHTGFFIAGLGQSDEDVNALAEGIITPVQFPPGVPMPPVKRLPAEFECSLCFKVKKFHKPSDWSKHVHEDVQPFTCTFATCAEPKSFKRKADWVRHENERHRQLEWWLCSINECSHKCYRKDNFVQHLVREHKLPEPKVKTIKNGTPAVRGPSSHKTRIKHGNEEDSNDEIDQVWKLVEECRHETFKNPKDESCIFCGSVCNSWKKLTVHLAKHMEQISMPVLGAVRQKEVTPETIISPIEERMASQQNNISPTVRSPYSDPASISPFDMSVQSGGEVMEGLATMTPRANYFIKQQGQQSANHQRTPPSTSSTPRHAQQLAASYAQPLGSSTGGQYPMPDYSSFSCTPAPQFISGSGTNRGFTHSPPSQTQSESPSNIYGGSKPPTSQPRAMPYDKGEGFQFVPQQHQPQQTFGAIEGNAYQFLNPAPAHYTQHPPPQSYQQHASPLLPYPQHSTSPVSYSQQAMGRPAPAYRQQQASTNGQIPMHYSQIGSMRSYPLGNGEISSYNQQQHDYAYNQH